MYILQSSVYSFPKPVILDIIFDVSLSLCELGLMLLFWTFFSNGIGRSGMFILTYVGMQTINYGNGIVNLAEIGGKMLWRRRNLLHKKDQIKFCYEAVLYYAQDILAKRK